MLFQSILAILFLIALVFFAYKYTNRLGKSLDTWVTRGIFGMILLIGLVIRLLMGYFTVGFDVDITLFKTWGQLLNDVGYGRVYFQDVFLDYPPGYLYVLSWLDGLRGFFQLPMESRGYTLLIKLPSILADMVTALLLYKLANKKFSKGGTIFLSAAYLFCPAVLINSSIWGQIDSFCVLILLCSVLLLSKNRLVPAAIVYGLAVSCKPQMLVFAPLYLFYTLYRKNIKGLLLGIGSALLTIMLVATPFIKNWDYLWLIGKYQSTMDYYSYYTINAYNFWGLIGQNWGALPESGLGLSLLNIAGPVIAVALCGVFMWKNRVKAAIFAAPAILMLSVYIFSVKMHERYLFPTLLFILLTYIVTREKQFFLVFAGLSTVHYLNVAYVLYLNNQYVSPTSWPLLLLSALHIALFAYFIFLCFTKLKENNTAIAAPRRPVKKPPRLAAPQPEEVVDRRLHTADYIAIAAVTVVYACVAFWNLGATTSANTSWTPAPGESVVFETGEEFSSLTFLPGIGSKEPASYRVGSNVLVEISADGQSWTQAKTLLTAGQTELTDQNQNSSVYAWHELALPESQRYLRLTAQDGEVVLNEIALKSTDKSRFIGLTAVSGNAAVLTDEHESVPLYPSYYNSTYFDEIYHARTAYEHLLGTEIYENTHPPLGKLIIAASIKALGMNPFGWRFPGVLFGVLMLPILYHILRRLFGNTFLCTIGTLLFACDFMHFAQTRIATIDTYAVFFILLMYDAMLVFYQKDLLKSSMRGLLLPLALSGIFMGLGVSAKWTCAYGAVGLGVLFFVKLVKDYKWQKDKSLYLKRAYTLCLWCVLFFIAIPFGIYFTAFLPLTLLPGNRENMFSSFVGYQTHMFSYHSGLVATHPFASPWYEWPLDIRSIWYSISYDFDGTGAISTISSFGNPLVWWGGLAALIYAAYLLIKKRSGTAAVFLLTGFAAVYLPWVLIPRLTFVYHYFTAVPFIIIALVLALKTLMTTAPLQQGLQKSGPLAQITRGHVAICGLTLLCILLFAVFFPVLSGAPTTTEYANYLEWLPTWFFR